MRKFQGMTEEQLQEKIVHTHIGGQAVIEGVMMRGKKNWAVAVRVADGSIHVEDHDLKTAVDEHRWLGRPLIRGIWGFYETLALAMKAFHVSSTLAGESEEERLSVREIALAMALGIGMAVVLFVVLPATITNWAVGPITERTFVWNFVDGLLQIVAFLIYIVAISRIHDIQRLFGYHGAEHKTIHAYERGLPLDATIIRNHPTQHVRCGTSFLLMVMIVALFVYSVLPMRSIIEVTGVEGRFPELIVTIVVRLMFLPLIAGVAYEVIKWAGRHSGHLAVQVLMGPGLLLQRLTTREPDEGMIEVAVAAMKRVIEREKELVA